MRIKFEDDDLRRLFEEPEFRLPSLGPDLIRSFRRKVHLVSRVGTEQDLRSYASLHFEKLSGVLIGLYSIRLNLQWRLLLRLESDEDGRLIVIVQVTDYH